MGPYTDVIYEPTAPTYAIRLGSIAPTLLYGLVSVPAILIYLQSFPLPRLGLTEWSLVLTPWVISYFLPVQISGVFSMLTDFDAKQHDTKI